MQRSIFYIIGALAFAGCTPAQTTQEPASPAAAEASGEQGGMAGEGMADECPMQVDGTSVTAENVEGGVALSFTTTGDVAELRRRVARMAEMHNRHASGEGGMGMRAAAGGDDSPSKQEDRGGMMGGGMRNGGMMGGGGGKTMMPPSQARAQDVEGGARIVLTPVDPAKAATLQERAGKMAKRMSSGECPMMSMRDEAKDSAAPAPDGPASHHPAGN